MNLINHIFVLIFAKLSARSSWTDTPEQKKKKLGGKTEKPVDLKKEAELQQIIKRDVEQSKLIEKHNKKKKRDKSLLEMHQDQLKKKKVRYFVCRDK